MIFVILFILITSDSTWSKEVAAAPSPSPTLERICREVQYSDTTLTEWKCETVVRGKL